MCGRGRGKNLRVSPEGSLPDRVVSEDLFETQSDETHMSSEDDNDDENAINLSVSGQLVETPVEETPVEETPVEDTPPVEGTPEDDLTAVPCSQEEEIPTSPVFEVKKRRREKPNLFSVEQEEELAEWYKQNELLYNKKINLYRDAEKKLVEKQRMATKLGRSVKDIDRWIVNMRSRYSKLNPPRTGSGQLTERDKWIQNTFNFLNPHIVRCTTRTSKKIERRETSFDEQPNTNKPVAGTSFAGPKHAMSAISMDESDDPGNISSHSAAETTGSLKSKMAKVEQMHRNLQEWQQVTPVSNKDMMLKNAHKYVENYLASCSEDTIADYTMKLFQLATTMRTPTTQPKPRQRSPPQVRRSHEVLLSDLYRHQLADDPLPAAGYHDRRNNPRWGGETPQYGRPLPVQQELSEEEEFAGELQEI